MDKSEIIKLVSGTLNESVQGLDKENPKFDFKSVWYDLSSEDGKNEFLKDSSSLANTVGLDGFIVIGFDEKEKKFNPAIFSDSKLKDTNEVSGLIVKASDRAYSLNIYDEIIDGHKLSIIHIPPSFDKPHVLRHYKSKGGRDYEHIIWVRRGTTIKQATKYDFDFMYYDQKNVIPDYRLYLSTSLDGCITREQDIIVNLTIENAGRRPIAITAVELWFTFPDKSKYKAMSLSTKTENGRETVKVANLKVQPGCIESHSYMLFRAEPSLLAVWDSHKKFVESITATIELNNGNKFSEKVSIIK